MHRKGTEDINAFASSGNVVILSSETLSWREIMRWMLGFAMIVAIIAHMAVIVVAGNRINTPWSGGGDTREYVEIAQNIIAGDGYTFAHEPTAFRAPLYPLLLAFLMRISPTYWPILLRILQFVASIATAIIGGELAARWFGGEYGLPSAVTVLLFPTMLFFSGEILTECFAALFVLAFLLALDTALKTEKLLPLATLGMLAGIAALQRFNTLPLIPIAVLAILIYGLKDSFSWRRSALALIAATFALAPWLIHNQIAFHGKAFYSTHSGFAAVEGIIMPLGRTQPGETDAIKNVLGWGNWDVETNKPTRPGLRDEAALNDQAWQVASNLWRHAGWRVVSLFTEKFSAFWFSTDQILEVRSLSWRGRLARMAGVGVYWLALVAAIIGWSRLHSTNPCMAKSLILYAAVLTAFHLPVTMNTRLRVPLFDPLLATLAGCSIFQKLRTLGLPTSAFALYPNDIERIRMNRAMRCVLRYSIWN
jgi:4-amino-4-deoxy-L-arabinose transferase-like glycosyltransferase